MTKVKHKKTLAPHDWRRHPVDCPRCVVVKERRGWYPMSKHYIKGKEQLATEYELSALQRKAAKKRKRKKKKQRG